MNKKITKLLLILILILAFGLRVYQIAEVPPSISWDEAAVGYNAYSIANYGRDEYGKFLPLYFRSFGEDKQPVHIYVTALFVKIFGLSEFSTRLPAAIFGALNVLLIFFVGRNLFNSNIGLLSSLFLAISSQNIFFSRFNHEANFALFFFMAGIILFYQGLKKYSCFLPPSFLSFGLSTISYHAAEIVVPPIVLLVIILYFNKLKQKKYSLLISLIILISFIILGISQPRLFGIARFDQTKQGNGDIEKTQIFKQTKNHLLGRLELILTQYSWHFSPQYLFIQGDKNPRLSSQTGEFYKVDAIFLILGAGYLLYKRSKEGVVLLTWAILAPLPSALVAEAPHAGRAMFMMGSWHLISALGLYSIISFVHKPIFKIVVVVVTIIILSMSLQKYLSYYYGEYTTRYAIEWQYGMKQIVEFVKEHKEYDQVSMTDARSQPYIFFLYYLNTPLPQYLNSVIYNNSESLSYNNVSNFDRYYFGGWDPIESLPNKGVLYIVTPSQYDGLKHKGLFNVKRKISYPNGLEAFYLVSVD